MRELDVPGAPFDAVTCLFDSIGYPQDDEGVVATLAGMRRHLAPGGRVAVEFLHAPALLANARSGPGAPLRAARRRRALVRISETQLDASERDARRLRAARARADGTYERGGSASRTASSRSRRCARLWSSPGCTPRAFVPAYEEGEIGDDTFHVIALAEAA